MPPSGLVRSILVVVLLALVLASGRARAGDGELCAEAIRRVERSAGLPAGLLSAVAFTESGRRDPERRRAVAWPWTVNNGGDGRYFASKEEAIAHVEALRRDGRRNIDVGCMQINLMHHPEAFASLEEALEPEANVAYGADFLTRLRADTGSWDQAVQRYHTAEPIRGQAYREKVYERWQDVRLASAVEGDPSPSAPRRLQRPEPAAGPALFPRRLPRTAAVAGSPLLASRGYLSLSRAPSRVAVLRPSGRLRPVRGLIRPDGTIEGSRLRIGPQRRAPPSTIAPFRSAATTAATPATASSPEFPAPGKLRRLAPRRPG